MDWYYAKNGQQLGPVKKDELAELHRNGTVAPTDLVWCESMPEWAPIGSLSDFSPPPSLDAPPPPPQDAPPAAPPSAVPAAPPTAAAVSFAPSGQTEPPNYLWQSIVVMLLCCLPLGIPALIFSTKVKPAFDAGDYAGALDASKKAKTWCLVAFILGLVVQLIIGVIYGFAIAAAVAEGAIQ